MYAMGELTHLYGPAVASLYSFHAFRSGLIQLNICRWMYPLMA